MRIFRRPLANCAIAILVQAFCLSHAAAQTPTDADLEALRFYIAEDNEQAIRSEIRRLQLRYPDWTAPEDLTRLQRGVPAETIDRIYSQIADGDFDGARSTIERTSTAYPEWTPSAQLLQTLSIGEAQERFSEAVSAGNGTAAVRIARSNPELLRCERVNNAWLLAEQYVALGQSGAALEVYRATARSCTDSDILIATLEKSAAVASVAQLAELAEAARAQAPSAAGRITTVEDRLRAGIVATGVTRPRVAGPAGSQTSTVTDLPASRTTPLASLRPVARPQGLATRRPTVSAARPRPIGGGAAASGGGPAVLSRARQAADRGDWSRCLALTADSQHGAVLSQRGWCALNSNRPMEALSDFRVAAARAPTAQTRLDSSYGMALAMLRLDMVDDAAAVAARTHFDKAQRLEIESQILDKRGVAAYQRQEYRRAIAYFDELERVTGIVRRDLALLRGYAYLNSGQRSAAKAEFLRLHEQMSTPASRRALSEVLR
ncbi:hypothetical protein [Salipiger mucosus]|nr:hypothetical protein [Salipiger mucosus]